MRRTDIIATLVATIIAFTGPHVAASQRPLSAPTRSIAADMDAYVAPLIALDAFSGVVFMMRDSTVLLERAYGSANIEHGVAMKPDHGFRVASVSKPFTRALVGRLSDLGVLSLDEPIVRWLPSFPQAERITLRLLLDHRAGVPSVNSLPFDEEGIVPNTLEALVDSLSRLPLQFAPGSARRYSNGGYAVVARVIECATARSYGDVLRTELLLPMGLTRTMHEDDGTIVPQLAAGYMPHPSRAGQLARAPFQEMATKAGGGSLVSSAHDLARWAALVGRSDVLRRETWAALFPTADSAFSYTGRAPGYNAALLHDRRAGITVVVLANNYAAGMAADIAEAAAQLARGTTPQALPVSTPTGVDTAVLSAAPGRYRPPTGWLELPADAYIDVRRSGDHLVIWVGSMPVDVLVPQPGGRFLARALWSLVSFTSERSAASAMEVRALYAESIVTLPRVAP